MRGYSETAAGTEKQEKKPKAQQQQHHKHMPHSDIATAAAASTAVAAPPRRPSVADSSSEEEGELHESPNKKFAAVAAPIPRPDGTPTTPATVGCCCCCFEEIGRGQQQRGSTAVSQAGDLSCSTAES